VTTPSTPPTQDTGAADNSTSVVAEETKTEETTAQPSKARRFLWSGKIGPAFWTIASITSLLINVILIIVLIMLGRQLFSIKKLVEVQVIGGLHQNFQKMDQAHILTTVVVSDTIMVNDTIPVVFDLPLKQSTDVILIEDTPIKKALVYLNGQAVPTDIVLRKGTRLYAGLDMVVPVNQTVPVVLKVPVHLNIPVDIALDQTDLHQPFVGLQEVVSPYQKLLKSLPNSWDEVPVCNSALSRWFCQLFLGAQ
jgi:hypothetical protein